MHFNLKSFKHSVIYRGVLAAFDQGLISAVNFLVQIILIKNVNKDEFGYYSLGFTIIMYLISVQNAVVNTPITVTLAERNEEEKKAYISAIFSGQLYALIVFCTFGAIVSLAISSFGFFRDYSQLAFSIFIGAFGVLNREFLRSYFFAEEKPEKVLKLDVYYGLIYICLIALSLIMYKITVPLVIIFMGIAAGFDSLVLNKVVNYKSKFIDIVNHYKSNWQLSKWSLIGVTVTHIRTFTYLYIVGILLGSAAMGEVSASRLLLMPLALIINGWGNVIRPYGSKLRERGRLKKFFRNLVLAGIIFPLFVLILTVILYLYSDLILKYFFTENYKSIFEYLLFWAISSCIGFFQANASYGLQVIKKFKSLALFNSLTMIITLLASAYLTQIWEIKGALAANLLGSLIFTIILWYILYKSIFTNHHE